METKSKYKVAIEVPEKVTATIFELPCIFSCHKDADGRIVYLLYDWDEEGHYVELHPGQWLCQDHDGRWTVEATTD